MLTDLVHLWQIFIILDLCLLSLRLDFELILCSLPFLRRLPRRTHARWRLPNPLEDAQLPPWPHASRDAQGLVTVRGFEIGRSARGEHARKLVLRLARDEAAEQTALVETLQIPTYALKAEGDCARGGRGAD